MLTGVCTFVVRVTAGHRALRTNLLHRLVDPIEPELRQRRPVVHRVENRVRVRHILVAVPGPRWHDEEIALLPLDALALDRRDALALEHAVTRRTVVAVWLRLLLC